MRTGKELGAASGNAETAGDRPLPALLSQALVAFTVEIDNQFERRMGEAGYPGTTLSLLVWSNLLRFLTEGALPAHELAAHAPALEKRVKFELGCLERWGIVTLSAGAAEDRPVPTRAHRRANRILRDGWGSGRGIRSGWMVHLTGRGSKAAEIWPPLLDETERRWQARFGDDQIGSLRRALEDVLEQIDLELPHGLPAYWNAGEKYPARSQEPPGAGHLPLPALLSQALLAYTIEFDGESPTPLNLCANALRVLGERPIPVGDIPRLTGGSPETSGIGWQIKPYIAVEPDPAAKRGKVVRLTPAGHRAQKTYRDLTGEIEKRWEAKFGKDKIRRLRESLRELFVPRSGDRLLLAEGLVPAEGTVRAGESAPALGRRAIASAARQRTRDLAAQTGIFLRDPAGALPHYPLWDMNRGFGP
jgi:DNA-binding MarR family transcriptional regulator